MHILEYIEGVRDRSWGWFKERADGKHAIFWLCVLAFGEAIVSPIVPETQMNGTATASVTTRIHASAKSRVCIPAQG